MDTEPQESPDYILNFPPEVIKAIQEILPSDDPFDSPDFNAVNYINEKFPAEQSLHHIDEVLDQMRVKITSIDDEIRTVVRSLTNVEQDGRTSLMNAQEAIAELSSRFVDIKERASESENRVKEITRDIKQLDIAKKNLTGSITTLNHLQMLVEGVDKLSTMKIQRQYGEIATLLQGVSNVLEHLAKYKHIQQVADLSGQVDQIKKDLEKQILDDFATAFHGPNAKRYAPSKELAEACLVVSLLDSSVKKAIVDDIIKLQLAEYEVLFAGGETDAWLNKVELRRKWFLKTALEFEKTLAALFPPNWQVPARLAYNFCELTHAQLTRGMQLRQQDIDVSTLLFAHKVMSELEGLLARKYYTFKLEGAKTVKKVSTNPFEEETNTNPFVNETTVEAPSPFSGAICKCFQPFLSIYLQNVDKRLNEQVEKFGNEVKNYNFVQLDAEASNVLPFCGELFTIYKNVLVEYLRLSCGDNLSGLAEIMQKYLREFANKVLRASLPKLGGNLPNMPRDLNMKELTAVIAQVQTLWREGDSPKLSEDDVRKVCSVLVSAEYCEEMTSRLETKLKEKICGENSSLVSMSNEEDLFHAVLTQCIALLVTYVEAQCDTSLSAMPKLNWTRDQTGDQSAYITSVSQCLVKSVPLVRHNLHTSRKYFTRFCDKLAAAVINRFVQQIYKCRPINSIGLEQLLLDCHALKATMLTLPIVGSKVQREPPQAYTRMVIRAMSRAELVLQVVMGEYNNNRDLIEKFIRVLPDASIADFQKVLEMRGVKERASVLELFRQKVNELSSTSDNKSDSPVHKQINPTLAQSPDKQASKIARLERMLMSRRLL